MEQRTPRRSQILAYLVITVISVAVLQAIWSTANSSRAIPYSRFQSLLADDQIAYVVVSKGTISGTLKAPQADGLTRFETVRVDADLSAALDAAGVEYRGRPESGFWQSILAWLLPLALFLLLFVFLTRRITRGMGGRGGGLMSVGRARAKLYIETDTRVTFADVAGVDEAKAELQEIVSFLRNPVSHARLGARMPKGVLLVGPPGTGKTLLARAVAGEAGVPFLSISGSEFVEMFVGVGAARVRDLFIQARQRAPSIIFIDELDALGRARGAGPLSGGHDEKEQTLNQLLVEMDGFDSSSGLVLLAATNRPEILDPALLRAGRFDRQVLVDRPDKNGREAILRVHVKAVTLGATARLADIAGLTPGFTGADLENLVNEAALAATRRGADAVEIEDFTVAIERIIAGLEKKNRILNPHERRVVATHEMGHAIVARAMPTADPVHKISIIPRGIGALGFTLQRPLEDRYLMSRSELEEKLTVLMGGRVAEQLVFGEVSTGAADDLAKATEIARTMATRYGMVPQLGSVTFDVEPTSMLGALQPGSGTRRYSDATAQLLDDAVRTLVGDAAVRARAVLADNRDVLEHGARELLKDETLADDALAAILDRVRPTTPAGPRTLEAS